MSEQDGRQTSTLQRPTNGDKEAWKGYWKAQGQSWRTEQEIDEERQKELAKYLSSVTPTILLGNYPFRGKVLDRADFEWLLAALDQKPGQGSGNNEGQWEHQELDLRGAILREVDLKDLPLAHIKGGLAPDEWMTASPEQREAAAIHLEGANLSNAHIEGIDLASGYLQKAILTEIYAQSVNLISAHLEGANLSGASLQGADLREAFLDEGTNLRGVIFSDGKKVVASLADVHWGNATLDVVKWEQATCVIR